MSYLGYRGYSIKKEDNRYVWYKGFQRQEHWSLSSAQKAIDFIKDRYK